MVEKIEDVARRLGVSVATLERRIRKAQAAIRRQSYPGDPSTMLPGYDPGSLVAKPDGWTGTWNFHPAKPARGRPRKEPPIVLAVEARERAILEAIGQTPKAQAQRRATKAAGKARTTRAAPRAVEVLVLSAGGWPPHRIAARLGITPRRVRQIQQAAKSRKSP